MTTSNAGPLPGTATGHAPPVGDVPARATTQLAGEGVDAQQLLRGIPDQLVWLDGDGEVLAVKPARLGEDDRRLTGSSVGRRIHDILDGALIADLHARLRAALATGDIHTFGYTVTDLTGDQHFEARVVPGCDDAALVVLRNVTDERRLEAELRQSQRLEAIGRLAGGIAHEINTPIQFIGDNVRFLEDAFSKTVALIETYRDCMFSDREISRDERVQIAEAAERQADVPFLTEEVPQAVTDTLEGVGRVSSIVTAMKTVGRPSQVEQRPADINAAIQSTVVVTRSEYKQVAEVQLDLDDIPPVTCHLGEISQVLLNMIVNAAHAIAARGDDADDPGRIRISTRAVDDAVRIEIGDNGCGIPADVRDRIFEPFFTTKDVGKGTGQGLSLSRALVVDRHDGTIAVDSTPGVGTTFTITLPVAGLPTVATTP